MRSASFVGTALFGLGCNPVVYPEPFSVLDACAHTAFDPDEALAMVDTDGDGRLTRADVAPGTAVAIGVLQGPDGQVMTTVHVDSQPYYRKNRAIPGEAYGGGMHWDCTTRAGVFPWHTDVEGRSGLVSFGVDFAEREVLSQGDQVEGFFDVEVDLPNRLASGELTGSLRTDPLEDLYLIQDLATVTVEHYAYRDITIINRWW